MPEILSLENFFMTRLNVAWHGPAPSPEGDDESHTTKDIDYDVRRRRDNNYLFALTMRYAQASESNGTPINYHVETEITGLFRFPETMDEEVMQKLVRLNGTVILYGILRGELAAFTGSFAGGKFILPAVNMQEVVANVESRKTTMKKKSGTKKKARNASKNRPKQRATTKK